jgi:hypothetical protein
MSHSLTLNKELGVIVLRAKETMSFAEIRLVLGEMVRLPGFRQGLCLIADFRGSGTTLTGEDVRQLATHAAETDAAWGVTKWAILASDSLMYGLSRMFGTLTDQHAVTTHVFHTVAEADGWLGIGVEVDEILARTPEGLKASRPA